MRLLRAVLMLGSALAALVLNAEAQPSNPRETLGQYIADLQESPGDSALREKIIKLAKEIKPAPEIPEEARRHFVRAVTAQKAATTAAGYELAISEYEHALLIAPWWPEAYFNLGTALELTGRFDKATDALRLYLLSGPSQGEARAAQDKIYAIEASKELARRQAITEAEATKRREQETREQQARWLRALTGSWVHKTGPDETQLWYWRLTVTGENEFRLVYVRAVDTYGGAQLIQRPMEIRATAVGREISGTVTLFAWTNPFGRREDRSSLPVTGSITERGSEMTLRYGNREETLSRE